MLSRGWFALVVLVACKQDTAPPAVAVPPPSATPAPTHATAIETLPDDVQVAELVPGSKPLRDQLLALRGAAAGRVFIVETTATWCPPCKGFAKYMRDPAMTKALAGVTLARVDIDNFSRADIESLGIAGTSVPWFVMFDTALHAIDGVSSNEWGDDVPSNMAPVLSAFVHGTLTTRKTPWHALR